MLLSRRRDHDRQFPSDPRTRALARSLYDSVSDLPIISPHGHVPAHLLASEAAFSDAAELFVTGDHYITRMLHAAGVDLSSFDSTVPGALSPREMWRILAVNWHRFAGTASGYWMEESLSTIFGIADQLGPDTADTIFDAVGEQLALPGFRPRALFKRFGIEFLATTDDPMDTLEDHALLAQAREEIGGRVVPTFRPDRYIDPGAIGFVDRVHHMLAVEGQATTFDGYLRALENRRQHFIRHGAVSADHGIEELETVELDAVEAESMFQALLAKRADAREMRAFQGHMLIQMARMSVADGLVMTIHPGVLRNHSTATHARYGSDTGHDIPIPTSFTRGLRPLLERYGLEKDLHLVLFTVDETVYSREIAPLAGFYPSVYIGAPWWFLDAPEAIARFRSAVTETAGFYRTSGFIDDTRAFLSIPARHDTARRVDSGYLAKLVVDGRITEELARQIGYDLVGDIPRQVFKL